MSFKAMHALVLPRQGAKLQKVCLEVRSWPGDLNFTCMGSKFSGNVRNECRSSHAKFGGAARRRFYAIWKKTSRGGGYPPPSVRGLSYTGASGAPMVLVPHPPPPLGTSLVQGLENWCFRPAVSKWSFVVLQKQLISRRNHAAGWICERKSIDSRSKVNIYASPISHLIIRHSAWE